MHGRRSVPPRWVRAGRRRGRFGQGPHRLLALAGVAGVVCLVAAFVSFGWPALAALGAFCVCQFLDPR